MVGTARTPADGIRVVDEVTVLGKGNRHRRAYLSPPAREWLQRYLALRKDKDPALFVTRKKNADGSYRMTVWTAEKIVRDTARRAGLSEDVSPHWLRHAAITLYPHSDSLAIVRSRQRKDIWGRATPSSRPSTRSTSADDRGACVSADQSS